MASNIKDRKIYRLSGFRGLDTENKLIKVSPFRASNGKNFIIDSGTLKTRPSIQYKETPINLEKVDVTIGENISYEYNDRIIDFYNYRGVHIFITNKHFYFKNNNVIKNEIELGDKIITNISSFYFEGLKPIFQEEKDCLFVFGLNAIYVISLIYDTNNQVAYYVLYELSNKPTIETNHIYYDVFDKLPKTYEPTLYIGDNAFEDVNLLSRVSKYDIFSKTNDTTSEEIVTYKLPTHYDIEKNGDLDLIASSENKDFEIQFYNDDFGDMEVLPLYMGVSGEDFDVNGRDVINNSEANPPIEVKDVFYSDNTFEYYVDETDPNNPIYEPIKEIIGLTKKRFFNMNTKTTGQNVFRYILNYINLNKNDIENNVLYAFKLDYVVMVIYRNKETNLPVKIKNETKTTNVYVMLKRHEEGDKTFSNFLNGQSSIITNENNYPSNYPDYPNTNATDPIEIELVGLYEVSNINDGTFIQIFRSYLEENKMRGDFENEKTIRLKGKFFEKTTAQINASTNVDKETREWLKSDFNATKPDFPTFDNPLQKSVIDIGTLQIAGVVDYNNLVSIIDARLLNQLNADPSQFIDDYNDGFVKFVIDRGYEDNYGNWYTEYQSIVATFTYQKKTTGVVYKKRSNVSLFKVYASETIPIKDNLYTLDFNSKENVFELKLKDFFYDYNNEPSINLKITFRKNPDYDLIAKNKFGITFGSENRMFLAGHEDYPNIDRFNVSNDLLGNNVDSQSYELSYFPSKNYRVLGGKGAINGYIVATDTQLYITKEKYPNDQTFFVRERMLDENGIVGYKEYKTSVNVSALNEHCLARFYNDIVMLDQSGLYGISLSSNVLTDERLLQLRSGFINKKLVETLKQYDKQKVFIYENNEMMYIVVGKKMFVADSRYVDTNENGLIGNLSYEIIEWDLPIEIGKIRVIDNEILLLDEQGVNLYTFKINENVDVIGLKNEKTRNEIFVENLEYDYNEELQPNKKISKFTMSYKTSNLIQNNLEKATITFKKDNYKILGYEGKDYHYDSDASYFTILNDNAFRFLKNGFKIYIKDSNDYFLEYEVDDIEENNFNGFTIPYIDSFNEIFMNIKDIPLYISATIEDEGKSYVLSVYKPDEIISISRLIGESQEDFNNRIIELDIDNLCYEIVDVESVISVEENIILLWESGVLDFGNNTQEKTMFKTLIYGTKQNNANIIKYGYKTMRRLKNDEMYDLGIRKVDSSNPMTFENVEFNIFALNTMSNFGTSIPTKENNFLYIQFIVLGEGNIELNSMEFLYKNNRLLKTIG